MIDLRTTYEAVAAAEAHFDLLEFAVEDVNVWLHCRDILLRPFVDRRLSAYRGLIGPNHQPEPFGWRSGCPLSKDTLRGHRPTPDLEILAPRSTGDLDAEILIWSVYTDYQLRSADGILARITDGFRALAGERHRFLSLILATGSSLAARFHHPHHLICELDAAPDCRAFPNEKKLTDLCISLSRWASDQGYPSVLTLPAFVKRLRIYWWRVERLTRLFQVLSPRLLVISSYSNWERSAAIAAANRLGISTLDVEHGFMGPYSPYGSLNNLPSDGVLSLPRYFWVWGRWQWDFLNQSLGTARASHTPIVGGDPWSYARHKLVPPDNSSVVALGAAEDATIVLLAWQPDMLVHSDPPKLIPAALLEAADAFERDTVLWVRLHPRQHHMIPVVERALRRSSISHWEVRNASQVPLARVLANVDLLLTSYSTVAFEANDQHIPVGVIDKMGVAMCSQLIKDGAFHDLTSGATLANAIRNPNGLESPRIEYRTQHPETFYGTLSTVLGGRNG